MCSNGLCSEILILTYWKKSMKKNKKMTFFYLISNSEKIATSPIFQSFKYKIWIWKFVRITVTADDHRGLNDLMSREEFQ